MKQTLSIIIVSLFFPTGGNEVESKKYVVMKARQVGSEIRDYDLRSSESNTLDPTYLKVQQIVNARMHEYICQILCLFVRDSLGFH